MPIVTDPLVKALGRKHGELNLSVIKLAKATGIGQWTLDKLLAGKQQEVQTGTLNKLNDWLYQHS